MFKESTRLFLYAYAVMLDDINIKFKYVNLPDFSKVFQFAEFFLYSRKKSA